MNIFYLDAEMHCNKHVVKMILETAQDVINCTSCD